MVLPPSEAQTSVITSDFQKIDPNTKIGRVAAVDSSASMAAVAGIPLDAVKMNGSLQSIQFVNGQSTTIANGTIDSIDKTTDPANPYLIVKFEPAAGGRAPIKGDLAVFIPSK